MPAPPRSVSQVLEGQQCSGIAYTHCFPFPHAHVGQYSVLHLDYGVDEYRLIYKEVNLAPFNVYGPVTAFVFRVL